GDPLPRVPGERLADRQRPDGGDVQAAHGAAARVGDALGRRQRRGGHGAGRLGAERGVEALLAKSPPPNWLAPPRFPAAPERAGMGDFLAKPIQAADLWAIIDRVVGAHPPADRRAPGQLNPRLLLAPCGGDPAILDKICQTFRARLPDNRVSASTRRSPPRKHSEVSSTGLAWLETCS